MPSLRTAKRRFAGWNRSELASDSAAITIHIRGPFLGHLTALGERDPETFAKRYAFGIAAIIATHWLLRKADLGVKPLDLPNFRSALAAYSWADFAKRPSADPLRPKTPDLTGESNGRRFLVEVSRRNFWFLMQDASKLRMAGLDEPFVQGSLVGAEKLEQQYTLSAPLAVAQKAELTLDDFYDNLWKEIQRYLDLVDSGKMETLNLSAIGSLCRSRNIRYKQKVGYKSFFVRTQKLENWKRTIDAARIDPNECYYVMWGSELKDGFFWCRIGDIFTLASGGKLSLGRPGTSDEGASYAVPIALLHPMRTFPLFGATALLESPERVSTVGFVPKSLEDLFRDDADRISYLATCPGVGPKMVTLLSSLKADTPSGLLDLLSAEDHAVPARVVGKIEARIGEDRNKTFAWTLDGEPYFADDKKHLFELAG